MKVPNFFLFFSLAIFISCQPDRSYDSTDRAEDVFIWESATPESQGISSEILDDVSDSLFSRKTKKLLIIRNDKIILERYADGYEDPKAHYTASLAKALVGGMSLLLAIQDGYIYPDATACNYIDEWKKHNRKSKITIRQLVTHTSGIENSELPDIEQAELIKRGLHTHMDIPGWKGQFWRKDPDPFSVARDSSRVIFTPGSNFAYSNPGIGMLTYAVTKCIQGSDYKDIRTYLNDRIYSKIGIPGEEFSIGYGKTYKINELDLVPSWGGGAFSARSVARLGRLMLKKGEWNGQQIIDPLLIGQAVTYSGTALPPTNSQNTFGYGDNLRSADNPWPAPTLGWYTNELGAWKYVPKDAYCGAGAGNQILVVIPSLDLIIVRFGENMYDSEKGEGFWLGSEKYLLNPLMECFTSSPYPKSQLITKVEFSPATEIISLADGSDNWPCTWGDDNSIYTAYGDGWGFEPKTEIKLSLGLAKVTGNPPSIKGINIRSASGEMVGEGKHGAKCSGMLMVDNTLYMLIRNVGNAQLGWSGDHGKHWEWANWKFTESFGCPSFLNFGQNYENARDNNIYIYSTDAETAYDIGDRMVMARVNKNHLRDWKNYEFFGGLDLNNVPIWTEDIRKRKAVFKNPGKCYRSGITYNAGIERYMWCQIMALPSGEILRGPRFKGGLAIYESPEPWGPWSTVFYDTNWDIGPGETGCIPAKWISKDGKKCYYVFSGNDAFSVREMILSVR
ncbi:serine hydrolase [Bacteroidota bacterium]